MAEGLTDFNVIKYQTKYGENCTATKKAGVVTIQGDKNGVREMPLNEFMQVFPKNSVNVKLEKTPEKDTVNFTDNSKNPQTPVISNKTLIGLIGLGVLALGTFLLTRGRSGAKAAEQVLHDIPKATEPIVDSGAKAVDNVIHTATSATAATSEVGAKTVETVETVIPKVKPDDKSANSMFVEIFKPQHAAENATKRTTETVAKKVEKSGAKVSSEVKGAEKTFAQEAKGYEAIEEPLYKAEEPFSIAEEIPFERKGAYGQDIYDPLDYRNKTDVLSPYYETPLNNPISTNPYDDPLNTDIFGTTGLGF